MTTKLKILILLFILIVSCKQDVKIDLEKNNYIEVKKEKLPQISILGTFHFANTSDYSAIVIEDLDTQKRQSELNNLVDNLSKFRPTKILVEREPSFTDTLTLRLKEYKNGNYVLPKNELYQLGFRLAKKLDLDTIFGVDHQMGLGDQELVTFLQENQLMENFSEIIQAAKVWANQETEYLKTHTLGQTLENLNGLKSDKFNRNLYLESILNVTDKGNSPASNYVSNWYKRNIFIKKNIDDLIEENDRILLIIGAGHSSILKDFYRGSSKVNYVELNNLTE
ncbi:DUF5694 domain-containing protein [Pseudofulvibacter geojedonensis]|uniref:DUF5694 domain-containing protein n=1 Tax=Pseudofulvibacter geojedonensis TaxID=1123758 RepID=A0ABW3HZN5_9FLAO